MSDFLRVHDRTADQLLRLVDEALVLEADFRHRRTRQELAGRRVAMWWDGEGFRNRAAFELGTALLGAVAVEIPGSVGAREAIEDMGAYLGNWFDLIVVRTPSFRSLRTLAESSPAVVVNARTRHNHPCEILGDLSHLHATGRDLSEPFQLVFVGEAGNLCHSWLEAAAVLPIDVVQVCPPGHEVDLDRWRDSIEGSPVGSVSIARSLDDVVSTADVVYTDCWPAGIDDATRRRFLELQITADFLDRCSPSLHFLPCPPVTRGQEVSDDAMAHGSCRVVEAKGWLLHAQNALLVHSLAGAGDA